MWQPSGSWPSWPTFEESPAAWFAAALGLLLLVQTIRLWWLRGSAGRRVSRHRALGQRGESAARRLLTRAGYRILEEQVMGGYEVLVDGRPQQVRLRADFLVGRGAARFIAEAKAGERSARVSGRATRRQLLEYCSVFPVDGVLLVDVESGTVSAVEFRFDPSNGRA